MWMHQSNLWCDPENVWDDWRNWYKKNVRSRSHSGIIFKLNKISFVQRWMKQITFWYVLIYDCILRLEKMIVNLFENIWREVWAIWLNKPVEIKEEPLPFYFLVMQLGTIFTICKWPHELMYQRTHHKDGRNSLWSFVLLYNFPDWIAYYL